MNFPCKEDIVDFFHGYVTFVKVGRPDIVENLMTTGETLTDEIKERVSHL